MPALLEDIAAGTIVWWAVYAAVLGTLVVGLLIAGLLYAGELID